MGGSLQKMLRKWLPKSLPGAQLLVPCCVTPEFENYKGGIFVDKSGCTSPMHAVAVSGFGTDPKTGTEFWIVRNSWGRYFGEDGWFRIQKGTNNLGIENQCAWGVPKLN